MKIQGVYDFVISGIDGNGYQYYTGMLEPERLDNRGLRVGRAFTVDLYHRSQKSKLLTFDWIGGVPCNWNLIAEVRGGIIGESEVPGLLRKYNLI